MTWISKRWWRRAELAVVVGVGLVSASVGLLAGRPGMAAPEASSTSMTHRLSRLEAEINQRRLQRGDLQRRLEAVDDKLAHEAAPLGTALRARSRVKRKLVGHMVAWQTASRRLERAAQLLPAGHASDARMLLRVARPAAFAAQADQIGVLQTIAADMRRTRGLIADRAGLMVQIAQNAAGSAAADASRQAVVDTAQAPQKRPQVDRELQRADADLQDSLGMLVKNETTRDFHRLKGTLHAPVSQPPTVGYGPRKQADSMSYVRHTGLSYAVDVGTPVRATASGLVVFAGRFEGFGNLVILDHGDAYHSLYAHLDTLAVGVNDRVKGGESVGKSGRSGSFDGPKLYFELRKDGHPINPTSWFIHQ